MNFLLFLNDELQKMVTKNQGSTGTRFELLSQKQKKEICALPIELNELARFGQ